MKTPKNYITVSIKADLKKNTLNNPTNVIDIKNKNIAPPLKVKSFLVVALKLKNFKKIKNFKKCKKC